MLTSPSNVLLRTLAPVSVVIPCFCCAETIDRALASVHRQTWRPAEVILVDDSSDDDTVKLLYQLEASYPSGWVQVIRLSENSGPGVARNFGWDKANQNYVAFLDADDAWHCEKIRLQLGWMLEHQDIVLTGHALKVLNQAQQDERAQAEVSARFKRVMPSLQLLSSRFHPPAVILKRNLPYRFVADKRQSEDYLLFTEICLDGHPCYWSPVPLAFLFKEHYGVSGLTKNLWLAEKGELDFYMRLARARRISRISLFFFLPFSLAKHLRRLFKDLIRRCLK